MCEDLACTLWYEWHVCIGESLAWTCVCQSGVVWGGCHIHNYDWLMYDTSICVCVHMCMSGCIWCVCVCVCVCTCIRETHYHWCVWLVLFEWLWCVCSADRGIHCLPWCHDGCGGMVLGEWFNGDDISLISYLTAACELLIASQIVAVL